MQILRAAAPSHATATVVRDTPTVDANIQLVSALVSPNGNDEIDITSVTFGAEHRDGGFVTRLEYMIGGGVRANSQHVLYSSTERAVAQAVQDAIRASGLLAQAVPTAEAGMGKPELGHTRLYLDRRTAVVDYVTDQPTAAIQSVLDAIAAYTKVRHVG